MVRFPPIRFSLGRHAFQFKGGVALEADWNGRILWEVREANHHHDGRLLKNGNVRKGMPRDVAGRVRGGLLHRFRVDGWHNRNQFT